VECVPLVRSVFLERC